jgi:hypothetical protein
MMIILYGPPKRCVAKYHLARVWRALRMGGHLRHHDGTSNQRAYRRVLVANVAAQPLFE